MNLKVVVDRVVLLLLLIAGFTFTGYVIDGVYYYSYETDYPVPLSVSVSGGGGTQSPCSPSTTVGGISLLQVNSTIRYTCSQSGLTLQLATPPQTQPLSGKFKYPPPITTGVGMNLVQLVAEYKTDDEDEETPGKLMTAFLSNVNLPPSDSSDTSSNIQFMTPVALTRVNHYSDEAEAVIGISLTALIGASLLLVGFWVYEWYQGRQGTSEEYQNIH